MRRAVITKNDLFIETWNSDKEDYEREVPESPISVLRLECTIEEGVTFLDIINIVEKYPTLMEFIEQYSWADPLVKWHAEARKPINPSNHLRAIEVYRHITVWEDSIEDGLGCHGLGVNEDEPYWSLGFTPLNFCANLPVVLSTEFSIYSMCNPKRVTLAKGEAGYTLLEILDSIYFEMTWYGSSDGSYYSIERDSIYEDLKELVNKTSSQVTPTKED